MKKLNIKSESDIRMILSMRDADWSLGRIAKQFKTNKPSILKALNLWDSGEQTAPDGKHFIITRGKVTILPTVEKVKKSKPNKKLKKIIEESDNNEKK